MSVAVPCVDFERPNFWAIPSGDGFDQESSKRLLSELTAGIKKLWEAEIITSGLPLIEAKEALMEIYNESSQDDWDSYGATAISSSALEEALNVIRHLPSSIRMPEIIAEPDGGIGFEWNNGANRIFIISVKGKHRINYAGIFGENKIHGTEFFAEILPSAMIGHIRRTYS